MLNNELDLVKLLKKDHVTICESEKLKLLFIECIGVVPCQELRDTISFSCDFILKNSIELLLVDYSRMNAPNIEDQTWIANHLVEHLKESKLRKIANLISPDFFHQQAIKNIYNKTSDEVLNNVVSKDFIAHEDALVWLLYNQFS
jgi:hypothetical protein